jgi:ABC-type branched-subunit amino acid transport system ATPase component
VTAAALEGLIAREEALVSALDAGDIGAIERETHGMAAMLATVAATRSWRESPELGERVVQAIGLAEAAGGRINYLADDNRRRIERLTTLAGRPRSEAYGRSGRFA